MKKISRFAAPLALLAACVAPFSASAQTGINLGAITPYSNGIITVINSILVPVLMAIAFVTFLWGVYKYFILGADNEAERTKGKEFTLWGIIGFAIILSLWGIVNMVMSTLGLSATNIPAFPTVGTGTYVPAGSTGGSSLFGGGTQVGGGSATGGGAGGSAYYPVAPTAAQVSQATTAFNNCISAGSSQSTCDTLYQTTLNALTSGSGTGGGNVSSCTKTGDSCTQSDGSAGVCGADSYSSCNQSTGVCTNQNSFTCWPASWTKKAFGYSCTDSSQCATGLYCGVDNVCTTATAGDKPFGYACTTSAECASGLYCGADGSCTTATAGDKPNGYSCSTSSECTSGYCDPADNTCSTAPSVGSCNSNMGVACFATDGSGNTGTVLCDGTCSADNPNLL